MLIQVNAVAKLGIDKKGSSILKESQRVKRQRTGQWVDEQLFLVLELRGIARCHGAKVAGRRRRTGRRRRRRRGRTGRRRAAGGHGGRRPLRVADDGDGQVVPAGQHVRVVDAHHSVEQVGTWTG